MFYHQNLIQGLHWKHFHNISKAFYCPCKTRIGESFVRWNRKVRLCWAVGTTSDLEKECVGEGKNEYLTSLVEVLLGVFVIC